MPRPSLAVALLGLAAIAAAQTDVKSPDATKSPLAEAVGGFGFRAVGPALSSGRIGDLAVDPTRPARYFVAAASGGVWRTENNGITFTPIFDQHGSFSIGCLALDPSNPHVLWVGTGENNSQRSVAFGDGVYRSRDGGKNFERLGLEDSEHIGAIAIDPHDGNVVYVAAQGPLWRSGEQRGLFKTVDGGKSWKKVLDVSEHTGINEVHLDPRDADVLYASAYQRRRHVWTLINGGPESAIYKSIDAGATWRKVTQGIPDVDKGRIGMAVSPVDPDVIYAIIEAQRGEGGVFRSTDRGETWSKQSSKVSTSPQYYNELVCDPRDVDTLYCLDTFTTVSRDGGKTWSNLGNLHRHVDDHALWIDPRDTKHLLIGGDGGLFESFDGGAHWDFKENLNLTQFYRVSADQALPFYNVYGGTQDNNSLGGPSRTTRLGGITNDDWFVTVGGDGYEVQVDPTNPDIVYTQWQHGGLVRLDRKSGEQVDIKPREGVGEPPLKWNWDTPLLLSAHSPTRLYFAANRLYRSDDRGDSWRAISNDLTRGIDRDQLEVMGRVWEVDTVAKNASTSFYGNSVALAESPLDEGVLYVGTDDGLVHVTTDAGGSWAKLDTFAGVPERTYVSRLEASVHARDRVYAAFNNHKNGDFKPYLLTSDDRGQTWRSIASDLPARNFVHALVEDHVNGDLLFVGTEFGVFVSLDRGAHWHKMSGGLPTIAVRDLEIQRREHDLIVGTFGRGIYILDDYAPLRALTAEVVESAAALFAVRKAPLYVPGSRLGLNTGLGTQGSTYFAAQNPPFGAVITFWLKEKVTTRKEQREAAQKKAREAATKLDYPTYAQLRAEDQEAAPAVFLTVRDSAGEVVRHDKATASQLEAPDEPEPWGRSDAGPLALGGTYRVTLDSVVDGKTTQLAGPIDFRVEPLHLQSLPAVDAAEVLVFQQKITALRRAVRAARASSGELSTKLAHARAAVRQSPRADATMAGKLDDMVGRLATLTTALNGDATLDARNNASPLSIASRVENVASHQFFTTAAPTATEREAYRSAGTAFATVLADLRQLAATDWPAVERALEQAGAPTTPGRLPDWKLDDR